jgi:hypothetical protein
MQGKITKYRHDFGFGVITTADGHRYRFAGEQIRSSADCLIGQDVDFVLCARQPTDIIITSGSLWLAFGEPRLEGSRKPKPTVVHDAAE